MFTPLYDDALTAELDKEFSTYTRIVGVYMYTTFTRILGCLIETQHLCHELPFQSTVRLETSLTGIYRAYMNYRLS